MNEDENNGNMQIYGQGHNCQITIGARSVLLHKNFPQLSAEYSGTSVPP
jgi:hypothetical protein